MLNQQLAAPLFADPAEVVAFMGAMQAQEYRMMRWAVAMRTRKPSANAFKKAYDSGRIIRMHLQRGTWQLVAAEDYHWMRELLSPKAIAVTKGWMSSNKISIPEDELARVREVLVEATRGRRNMTSADYAEALAARGMEMDKHRLSYHIRMAEFDGVLCSGDLMPAKASYALVSEKVGAAQPFDRDEALKMLTRKYFLSRSPATLEDYVWWSGLGVNDCKRGIEMLGDGIRMESWKKREYYVHRDCRIRGFRKGQVMLIPPYDEILIGYKSRDIVLAKEHSHRAHNNSGIFQPIIAYDGMICGNWKPFEKKMVTDFFIDTDATHEMIEQTWNEYKRYESK